MKVSENKNLPVVTKIVSYPKEAEPKNTTTERKWSGRVEHTLVIKVGKATAKRDIYSVSFWLRNDGNWSIASFYFSLLNHALCLLSVFPFISVPPALAFILLHLLPMVLFGFPSHYSSLSFCLVHALVAAFSQGSVPTIYNVCLFSPSWAFFLTFSYLRLSFAGNGVFLTSTALRS